MKNLKKANKPSSLWKTLVQVIILGVAAYALAPQLVQLSENRHLITQLSISWLLLGEVIFLTSFLFAALVYRALGGSKLPVGRTTTVQLATAFTNRLLPSGIGGIGTNTLYLIRRGYKKTAALLYVTANNIIGFFAFIIVLLVTGALSASALKQLFGNQTHSAIYISIGLLIVALCALLIQRVRSIVSIGILQAGKVVSALSKRPAGLLGALLASVSIPLCYTASLYCCLRAAGISLDLHQIVLVFGAGAIAVSASPTPGGLGATEVAMVAALSRYGVMNANALTCIIAFRVISFWLPIIPGYIFFRICTRRKYI